jgi:hypothetical protein
MKEGFWSSSHNAVSQQAQGEIQELDLEERRKVIFPWDTIEPVTKGIRGADVI